MTSFDATIETAAGDHLPAMALSGGRKLPGSAIAVDGAPVSTSRPMPVTGEVARPADQHTAELESLAAILAAIEALGDGGFMAVDSSFATTLSMPPGAPFADLASLVAVLDAHVAAILSRLDALEVAKVPPGGDSGDVLVKASGADHDLTWSTP